MTRDVLKRLAEPTIIALRCSLQQWPRGLLGPTPLPDAWMGVLETPEGARRLVAAGDGPRGTDQATITLVRNRRLTAPLRVAGAAAQDRHLFDLFCELLLTAPAREHELAALARMLPASGELHMEDLAQRLLGAGGGAALRGFVAGRTAAELCDGDLRGELLTHLRSRLRDFLFEHGLELDALGGVECASESLNREQALHRRAAEQTASIEARQMVEQAALAATRRKLEDLGDIFTRLRSAAGAEDGQWHELLRGLSPAQRGRLLRDLWRITPDRNIAHEIAAIGGTQLAWLTPQAPQAPVRSATLPADLGPLRSVTSLAEGPEVLYIGAARGLWAVDAASGQVLQRFECPGSADSGHGRPTTGFNGVALFGEWLVASHSQLGVWAWEHRDAAVSRPLLDAAGQQLRLARAPLITGDGRLLVAVDQRVCAFDRSLEPLRGPEPVTAAIHALATCDDEIYVATADGRVLRDRLDGSQGVWEQVHRESGPVESLQARRWHDLLELVIPAGGRGVLGVYPEQAVVTPLLEGGAPIRRVWVCDDLIVGLTELRERLVLLHAPTAASPVMASLARHFSSSIQDVAILTRQPG